MPRSKYRENAAYAFLAIIAGASLWSGAGTADAANANKSVGKTEAHDMRLVGYDDLQARSAYQPVIHQQDGRWIAYIGHHGGTRLNPLTKRQEKNGTSILDVTDPKHPKYLYHIPGGEKGGAQMVRVCDGKQLPKGDAAKVYMLRTHGISDQQIWDVTAPEHPALLTTVVSGLKDTHKNWWECDTGIAYLVVDGQPDGWRTKRMTKIYDLSDPLHPRFIRDFGLIGQEPGSTMKVVPQGVHGPIALGNRVYFGYGTLLGGVIQVVDRDKLLKGNPGASRPFAPAAENLLYPQIGRIDMYPTIGAHTVLPVLGMDVAEFVKFHIPGKHDFKKRDFIVAVNESTQNECREDYHMMFMIDITDPAKPFSVSNFHVPEASGHFCDRGGRFGTHSSNENMTPIYYRRMVFIAWFNAGVRAVDIRDPFSPREAAYYIPAITKNTDKRCVNEDGAEHCKIAIQTNNVEVDDRGFIYIVDRANTGMHILELTGAARKIADFTSAKR